MKEKYFLTVEDKTLGLKYDSVKDVCILGGYLKYRMLIENIILEYFKKPCPKFKVDQNKVRYHFGICRKDFNDGCERLRDHRFVITQVRNLERVMR